MRVETKKIPVDILQIGMFVSGTDRPWTETPFPIQGFYLNSLKQIDTLQQLCEFVWIHVRKSRHNPDDMGSFTHVAEIYGQEEDLSNGREVINIKIRTIQNPYPYKATASNSINKELKCARKAHKRIQDRIARVLRQMAGGGILRIDQLRIATHDLVDSVIRNPDAFAYLIHVDNHHQNLLNYSIRVATWAVLTGRHLDITRDALSDVAIAALLCKLGYTTMPKGLLITQGTPSPQVEELFKRSLSNGVKMLRSSKDINSRIVKIVSYHLERHDGSGYPRGSTGRQAPFLAQLVGLADYYENLISHDFRDKPYASTDAIRALYRQRNALFEGNLVNEFIQAIGLYPSGSIVRLNNNRTAIVVNQESNARLKPTVLVVNDNDRKWWQFYKTRIVHLNHPNSPDFITASLPALSPEETQKNSRLVKRTSSL
ncbi:MAG: hypothetical protein COA99_04905 [Moraxellaceae bacterium]|nr:MAG: hypothetical protein COA99_04905 [Moraxellaceae bacterium]